MCNTVAIRYTCNHFVQFHRSTCRSVTWITRPGRKPRVNPRLKLDNRDSDAELPSRGRTLERESGTTSTSSSPPTSQSKLHSPTPKNVSKAACKSMSELVFRAQERCGPCQRSYAQLFSRSRRPRHELPTKKKRKHLKRGQRVLGGSPLKHELTVEELLKAEEEDRLTAEYTEKAPSTKETTNGITLLLRLEPARFWRCWRRFDGVGRRYVDFVKS